jgi:hypothetical protein
MNAAPYKRASLRNSKTMNKKGVLIAAAIVLISVSIGLIISEASQAVGIKIHAKDLPEHGLIIVKPSDPEFEVIAFASIPNLTRDELEALRPFSMAIKNTGPKMLVAHTIIWEGANPEGRHESYVMSYANSEVFTDRLEFLSTIDRTNLDKTIKAGSSRLLSLVPMRRAGPSGGGGGSRGEQIKEDDATDLTQRREQLRTQFMGYSDLTISIDGAFFEDGEFVGPDVSHSFERLEAQVEAKRQLRTFVAESVKLKKTPAQIFQELQTRADMPVNPPTQQSSVSDYSDYFTKFFANQFILQRRYFGDGLLERLVRSAGQPQPRLTRSKRKE